MQPIPTGVHGNVAGGTVSATQMWGTLNGVPILRRNDPVANHDQHSQNAMAEASLWFTINGIGVARLGDKAQCGHALNATALWFRIS